MTDGKPELKKSIDIHSNSTNFCVVDTTDEKALRVVLPNETLQKCLDHISFSHRDPRKLVIMYQIPFTIKVTPQLWNNWYEEDKCTAKT